LAEVAVEPTGKAFHLKADQQLPVGLSSSGVSESFSTASPISLYGSTKLASEILVLEYGDTFDFLVWSTAINRSLNPPCDELIFKAGRGRQSLTLALNQLIIKELS
jgi:hypothetical protein